MNTPKLRFPEFKDEWKKTKFNDIAKFFSGGTPSSTNKRYYTGSIPFIKSGEISQKHTEQHISEEGLKNSSAKLVNKGDLLFALYGATSGEVAISKLNGAINQAVLCIKTKGNNLFLFQLLSYKKNSITQKYLQGGQGNLSAKIVKEIDLILPTLPEQTKIANFLSTVDKRIELLNNKLNLLEEYKKGATQKLFSQEVRFKEENGEEFPEWEKKRLGGISTNHSGTPLEKYTTEESNYNFISIGNYGKNGCYVDNGQRVKLNDITKKKLLYKNDIVMVLNDKTKSGDIIGASILIDKNDKYIYNQRSQRITFNSEIVNIRFMWFQLNWSLFRKEVFRRSQGGTQIYINFSEVEKIKLSLPSLPEQTKIANFLSSIDTKIELATKELNKTEEYKRGLLQQMFI